MTPVAEISITEAVCETAFKSGIKPTERLSVSEWSDKYRIIPKEGGSKEPGQWRTSRFPFLREPMDNLSSFSPIQETIIMAGTQVGKTEIGTNFFGYSCHIDPCNFLLLLPTLDLARRRAVTKIQPTIDQTPVLAERIAPAREKDSGNTKLMKSYQGGTLIIAGANSAASLSDISAGKIHLDEVDRYVLDLENEGDTIFIASNRADSFGDDKKILLTSTPTIEGISRIKKEFLNSDQRHYYVPCPFCGHMQYLRWKDGEWHEDGEKRVVFERDITGKYIISASYKCEGCGELIPEHFKTWMFDEANGAEWRPHNPGHRRRGYKLPSYYSPLGFVSWAYIAQQFLDAKHEHDIEKLKVWKNTRDAETWDEEKDSVFKEHSNALLTRVEKYGPAVPMAALVLDATVDVQESPPRLECEIKAWGPDDENWTLEYKIIDGDPSQAQVWTELADYLWTTKRYHQSGAPMPISITLIDAGYLSEVIYKFVRTHRKHRVFSTMGSSRPQKLLFERAGRKKRTKLDYFINTTQAKDHIFHRLEVPKAETIEADLYQPLTAFPVARYPYYMHFNEVCDEEYFLQLLAETKKTGKGKNRYKRTYEPTRARNEALDLNVLHLAAIRMLKPNWQKIVDKLASHMPQPETGVPETSVTPAVRLRRIVGRRIISRGIEE